MGRFENIIERNKHPYRRRGFAVEVPAILILLVLGLLAFTNGATPPAPPRPPNSVVRRVHDVPMMRAPKPKPPQAPASAH